MVNFMLCVWYRNFLKNGPHDSHHIPLLQREGLSFKGKNASSLGACNISTLSLRSCALIPEPSLESSTRLLEVWVADPITMRKLWDYPQTNGHLHGRDGTTFPVPQGEGLREGGEWSLRGAGQTRSSEQKGRREGIEAWGSLLAIFQHLFSSPPGHTTRPHFQSPFTSRPRS